MSRRAVLRFVVAVCMAIASLAVLLGLLADAQKQVYAAASQPVGGETTSRLAPPPEPARAPAAAPLPAPLSQGGGGHSVITVCSSCPYHTIQAAVSAVDPDGTVKVAQGVYTDADGDGMVVQITKTLTLRGGYTTTNWTVPNPEAYPTELDGLGAAGVISIAADIAPAVEGFYVYNGEAERGGGIYVSGGSPALRRNRIHGNTANLEGGGIYIAAGSPVVQNNLIYLNQSSQADGGGIYVASGTPLLQHNTLYSNTASDNGGGICVAAGAPVISATILVSNSASSGGGIYAPAGSSPVLGYNDVWGSEDTGGNHVGEGIGNIFTSTNPLFEDPAGEDFHLRPGSPCVDQVPVVQTVGLDYEGQARPFGEKSDIGAHEFYTGTCFARLGNGRVYTTVQAAVDATTGSDLIEVAGYCAGVDVRDGLSQTVYISRGLTLQGGYTLTNWSIPDPDIYPTVLDAQEQGRVVYVNSTAAVVVEGFHVCSGLITGTSADDGSGFYLGGGVHVVRDNEIYGNTANRSGGGVYINSDSGAHVYGNEIYSNMARDSGGGVYINGGARVYDNEIYINTTVRGGGIYVNANATVQDNVIHDNYSAYEGGSTSADGGGIYVNETAATVRGNWVYENTADNWGGGIYVIHTSSGAVVEYNKVYSNTVKGTGRGGAGIYTQGSYEVSSGPTIRYNTISSNTVASGSDGGGIYMKYYSLVQGNTVYNNWASNGGGIAARWSNNYSAVPLPVPVIGRNRIYGNDASSEGGGVFAYTRSPIKIENNLIYDNTHGDGINLEIAALVQNNTIYGNIGAGLYRGSGYNSSALIPTIRNNIIVSNTGHGIYSGIGVDATYCNVWGNATPYNDNVTPGTGIITDTPPQLVSPGVDFHLQADSPCKDTADPVNYPNEDFAGYTRYFGSAPDMGAYEYYSGTCFARIGDARQIYPTVQAAVDALTQTDVVKVAGMCQETFARTAGSDTFTQTVYISQPLTLRGGYTVTEWTVPTTQTVLDAEGQGRVVYITATGAVTVDGFVIQGGDAITGGGLYIAIPLSPTIQNVVFYGNSANCGGGFGSAGGNPRLYNNTFVSNTATEDGGAIYLGAGSPVVSNTIVVSNEAVSGGGLFAAAGAVPSLAYNDVWQNGGGNYTGVAAGTNDFHENPRFVDPAGGDFHLRAESPCVHRGDPGTGLVLDFEGDDRPLPEGGWYDVGADESTSYPDVDFGPPGSALPGIPGGQVVHVHFLTNTGTVGDIFDVEYELITSGLGTGWDVVYIPVFTLAAGEREEVPVTVYVPNDAISDTYATVVLTATSRLNDVVSDVVSNTTSVNWNPGIELTPAYAEQVDPGTVMTYVHTLANTGNAGDTFSIDWSSGYPSWVVVTPTQNVAVGPRMTTTLWVVVSVPAEAPGGLVATVVVTASSTNPAASDVWAVVTDTTEVNHITGPRYVRVDGDDTLNNCSVPGNPCGTIVHAAGQAASGDTVMVAAGTYSEHDVSLNKDITLRGGYSADFEKLVANPTIVDAEGKGRVFYIFGSPTIEGLIIQGGSTLGSGGGVYVDLGSPTLRRNVITGNTAGVYGGGFYNEEGNPTLERNALAFNAAQQGGGFANGSGSPNFWNNLVYENSATADGGGVYVAGGGPRIWHDTIYSNTADYGGGLYLDGGSPVVSNTIVVSNTALITGGGVYKGGGGAALDYNDVWGNSGGDYGGEAVSGVHSLSQDPLFVDAAGWDFHLRGGTQEGSLEDSPCINVGDDTDATVVGEDLDGQPRWMGDHPDIGADEFRRVRVELEPDCTGGSYSGDAIIYTHIVTSAGYYTETLDLTWHNEHGWDVEVNGNTAQPLTVMLGVGFTATVQVAVHVPASALSDTVDVTTITATSQYNADAFDTAVNTTTVVLTRTVVLKPDRVSWVDSDAGSPVEVSYTHRLTNTGNYTDTFDLIWVSDQGLTVTLVPTVATLLGAGVGTTVCATVTVSPMPTDTVLVDTTVITAVSQSVITVSDRVSDTTYVNLDLGVELEPNREGSSVPGSVSYIHTLTNTGNYTDTFTFTAESSQGWKVKVPDSVEVGPGLAEPVWVTVTIPDKTLSDTVDISVIMATSHFSTAVSASVVDTTTVKQAPGVSVGKWP